MHQDGQLAGSWADCRGIPTSFTPTTSTHLPVKGCVEEEQLQGCTDAHASGSEGAGLRSSHADEDVVVDCMLCAKG